MNLNSRTTGTVTISKRTLVADNSVSAPLDYFINHIVTEWSGNHKISKNNSNKTHVMECELPTTEHQHLCCRIKQWKTGYIWPLSKEDYEENTSCATSLGWGRGDRRGRQTHRTGERAAGCKKRNHDCPALLKDVCGA